MSFLPSLLIYASACSPDAGAGALPPPPTLPFPHPDECEPLLQEIEKPNEAYESCTTCNKRKRDVEDARPDLSIPQKRRRKVHPRPKGCRLFLARLQSVVCSIYTGRRKHKVLTRYRSYKQKKPYSAISVHVERLTSETYEEDDLAGIPDLVEVVRLQGSGPAEAARALRKKLKYGNVHRQLRALTILDGLLQNGGSVFQRAVFHDEPLLERLRIAASDPLSDPDVREKCKVLFGQWAASSKDNPGLQGALSLYKQLPKKNKALEGRRAQSKVLRETEEEARRDDPFAAEEDNEPEPEPEPARRPSVLTKASGPSAPRTSVSQSPVQLSSGPTFGFSRSSKKDKKNKQRGFNLEREKPAMLQSIAAASVASTNLSNALKLVNRESKRVSEDPEVLRRFETCKKLRRQILRYIQYVESDDYLGGLIHANEELVTALIAFEVLDKSVDDDSDSELEEAQHQSRTAAASELKNQDVAFSRLSISEKAPPRPPRQASIPSPPRPPVVPSGPAAGRFGKARKVESESESEEEEDDDAENPFGDRNAATTPRAEKKGYSWREV